MVPVTRSIQLALPTLSAFVTRLGTAIVPTLRSLAWTFAGVLAVVAVVHLAGITFWPLELLHHFLLIYALLAACLAIAAFTFRMARLAIAASVLMLFFAGAYGRSADFFAGSTAIGLPVSVLTNNVYCGNWDPEGLRNWLATRPADVVALEEVPAHVERALAGLSPDIFPYSARIPAGRTLTRSRWRGCEGILLLSRFPIDQTSMYQSDPKAWPSLTARLRVPEVGDVWLVIVHANDPIHPPDLQRRDQFLASIAPTIASMNGPVLVVGDFNATPFTPVFRQFLDEAELSPPRSLPGSYPSNVGALGIPIDHVLVRDAHLASVHALAAIGSDHRPVLARIVLPTELTPPEAGTSGDQGR